MTQSENIGDLTAAIAAAMGSIGYVRQTGQNTHHRYSYASDEDLAKAVNPALVEHGLAISPAGMHVDRPSSGLACVTVTWRVSHSSGQWMTLATVGEGADKQDKAAYKAMTGARKYLLRLLFCIATGDDAERGTGPSAPPAPSLPEPVIDEGKTAKDMLYRLAGDAPDVAAAIEFVDGLDEKQARIVLAKKQAAKGNGNA
jgi:hypothetical protein